MYPLFLNEALVQSFVFYQAGSLYQGFVLKYQIFKLVRYFSVLEREYAINLALTLQRQQLDVIITASAQRYGVWVTVAADVECEGVRLFPQDTFHPSLNAPSPSSVANEPVDQPEPQFEDSSRRSLCNTQPG
ncbi:MAG: hypothetical protein VKL39_07700 [Leptolyngbyaceae bacterium]|nr:hypothetical protein [Leptolyngbyaceae bacterium]